MHHVQVRKGTSIPYIAHLLAVSATMLEYTSSRPRCLQLNAFASRSAALFSIRNDFR